MPRITLIHWNLDEAAERVRCLKSMGHEAWAAPVEGPQVLRAVATTPPQAVVIDLSRLPSHGREIAIALRRKKATRHIPLIFVDGDRDKTARIRQLLPDAIYADWRSIRTALKRATVKPPASARAPIVPRPFAAYAGRPLPAKLGINAGCTVLLVGAPGGFVKSLGQIPEGVRLVTGRSRQQCQLLIWFVRSSATLNRGLKTISPRASGAPLWIAWPKKASGAITDLSEQKVRGSGLAAGLVDYKICSIDSTWSGLLFRERQSK
jgi:CheY-like chemotaxis protein